MNQQKNIAILGNGMVGSVLHQWFKQALVYDVVPQRRVHSLEEVNQQAEWVFVCVPTPFDQQAKSFDLSLVEQAVESLNGKKVIIIKSTVLPGTTQKLQQKYTQHRFLVNPEFLTEKTAWQDFVKPEMQLVGCVSKSDHKLAKKVLASLPQAKLAKLVASQTAEAVKYFRNCFYATKVVYANQFFDFCQQQQINYEQVKSIVKHDKMIAPYHLEIFHQGGRGAGGKCLAKDLAGFSKFSQLPLLKKVNKLNKQYLKTRKQ
ncbi:MAG: hypothetical protein GF390_01040 [Candidatus Pacebacteria bacterium]|nr:hypothetical protein [Candidatus Paceibacterota bacterium]